MEKEYIPFNLGELHLPIEALNECNHQGDCYNDCKIWAEKINWAEQNMRDEDIKNELLEYGAWSEKELSDIKENKLRILWIAAGNYQDRESF